MCSCYVDFTNYRGPNPADNNSGLSVYGDHSASGVVGKDVTDPIYKASVQSDYSPGRSGAPAATETQVVLKIFDENEAFDGTRRFVGRSWILNALKACKAARQAGLAPGWLGPYGCEAPELLRCQR